ncbi:MAG: SRPBCC family protein [Thermoplasmata archaeon]|nr:SRPBCC family protein [Thermoplasmata archaeon]MCI4355753.1 SRPBCC family protein [Thermoplasmata archaeon]
MTDEKPGLTLDNHYDAPPEFAYSWLTDFHDDDGTRYFGMTNPGKVTRNGTTVQLEGAMRQGTTKMTVTLAPPDHWWAEGGFFSNSGRQVAHTKIVETLRADGAGTTHHAEFYLHPDGFVARLMFMMGSGKMRRDMRTSFDRLKADLDSEYRAVHA